MRNIILLLCIFIGIIFWAGNYFVSKNDSNTDTELTVFTLSQSYDDVHFDIKKLAYILGVDYQKVEAEKIVQEPKYTEVELSLVSIYTSGDLAKIRLRLNDVAEGDIYIDAIQGDEFNSLLLSKIGSTSVELINNGKTVLLKMYKPQVINIAKETNVEEVKND